MPHPHELYSPERRTAVLFAGTGADGAYHAGVLRALCEAGVKVDLLAGRGVGVVAAVFGAVDAGSRLWDSQGFWTAAGRRRFYGWQWVYRACAYAVVTLGIVLLSPTLIFALALAVYPVGLLLGMAGLQAGASVSTWYSDHVGWLMAPGQLPTWVPRLATLVLAGVAVTLAVRTAVAGSRIRPRREMRGRLAWRLVSAPLDAGPMRLTAAGALWALVRVGGSDVKPGPAAVSRRYAELLEENLGQPGWRELLIGVHDIDARRDLVFGLLAGEARRRLFPPPGGSTSRRAEAFDLGTGAKDHLVDVMAGALSPPLACDPHLMRFGAETAWRGEAHRLCDRPALLVRLVEECAAAGVEQLVLVSGAAEPPGPHGLRPLPADVRERMGEQLVADETAAMRDALHAAQSRFHAVFVIRPAQQALGPLEFGSISDEGSENRHGLPDLMQQGYEDAQRAFVEPAVGGAGDRMLTTR